MSELNKTFLNRCNKKMISKRDQHFKEAKLTQLTTQT